jgi:hypothetical protein
MGKMWPLGDLTMNAPVFANALVVSTKPYVIARTRAVSRRAARMTTGRVYRKDRMGNLLRLREAHSIKGKTRVLKPGEIAS